MPIDRPGSGDQPREISDPDRLRADSEDVPHPARDPLESDTAKRLVDAVRGRTDTVEPDADSPGGPAEPETIRRIRAAHGDRDVGAYEPTGDELLEIEDDEKSRLSRFERKTYEVSPDVADAADEVADAVEAYFAGSPRPTGQAETRVDPWVHEQTRDQVDGGSVLLAAAWAGFLGARAYVWSREKLAHWKGDDDAGNR